MKVPSIEREATTENYAPRTLTIPADGPWMETLRHPLPINEMPAFADIPEAGQVIEEGRPVLTLFGRSEDSLRRIAADLDRVFANGTPDNSDT